jgi:hypothetical protein
MFTLADSSQPNNRYAHKFHPPLPLPPSPLLPNPPKTQGRSSRRTPTSRIQDLYTPDAPPIQRPKQHARLPRGPRPSFRCHIWA